VLARLIVARGLFFTLNRHPGLEPGSTCQRHVLLIDELRLKAGATGGVVAIERLRDRELTPW